MILFSQGSEGSMDINFRNKAHSDFLDGIIHLK